MNEPMLGKLFASREHSAAAPAGERLYAVGDIHGRADLLDRLLDLIDDEDAGDATKRLVFLGDYIDRGPHSREVVDRLVALRRELPEAVFLLGNHEQAFLDFLDDPDRGEDWIHWGGAATLESYGVTADGRAPPLELASALLDEMPDEHLSFMRGLGLCRELGDYLFVHAGVRPGVPLGAQQARDLLWIRSEFHNAPADQRPDKVVVHGHHPIKKPLDAGWRIAVDTGACFSGMLTAAVLEGASRRFLST